MPSTPTRNLVLGGTGLIGSHLLYTLAQKGPVTATAQSSKKHKNVQALFTFYNPQQGNLWYRNIQWIDLDLLDFDGISEAIGQATHVYHCAALVSFHRIDFYRCIEFNRKGTENVVNACLSYPQVQLCYVSSTAALGRNPGGLIDERCSWKATDKNSGYSVAKFGAEKEVWRGIEEGLSAVIINPCTVIGPGIWESGSMELFYAARKGMLFYPNGANATVDVRDVVACMMYLMEQGIRAQKFLCTGTNQDFRTLFTIICQRLGKPVPRFYAPYWLALSLSYLVETWSLLRGKRRGMTIESTRAAYAVRTYNSRKLKTLVPFEFCSLEDSIDHAIQGRILP